MLRSVYEMYLGSFVTPDEGQDYANYREIAPKVIDYVKKWDTPCGTDAGYGTSSGCFLGLSGDRLLCPYRQIVHRRTLCSS